jgi:AcrR family transcriptional regulator
MKMTHPSSKPATPTAPPARPGRRERRRAETRGKLFRAAMRLFAERGFFDTTTEDITEAADVAHGTFFNYFPTKQHVLIALSEIQLSKVLAALQEAESERTSIREVLRHLAHTVAEEPGRSPALTRSLLMAFLASDEIRQLIGAAMRRGRRSLAKIIGLGQRRGEIRTDQPATELAMVYQQSVLGTLLLWGIRSESALAPRLEVTFRHFWAAAARKGRSR